VSDARVFTVRSSARHPAHTFVLLHGIGLSHREFGGLARELARFGRVVAFDLPGFGSQPRPRHTVTVEEHAAIVGRALDRLAVGPVVVVGHSMGAQFAIELARQKPHDVAGVVLIGPVVDAGRRTLRDQAIGLLRDSPLEPPRTQVMVAFDYLRCGVPWFLAEAVVMRDYPTEVAIADLTQPVLVIRGEKDPIADAPWCASLAARASDGRTVTIAGHRHNVLHSAPVPTADAIVAFAAAAV